MKMMAWCQKEKTKHYQYISKENILFNQKTATTGI
jgi:hypothetical protein